MKLLKALGILILLLFIAGGVAMLTAPRSVWPGAVAAPELPDDLDAWLAAREGVFDDITEGAGKTIQWAGEPGARTPLALVYLHGFSATRQEISPVAETVAQQLGANLFATRFAGHGRPGAALGAATVDDWAQDLAEAIAVGQRLGERVVLIGTSTGGSLAALAAVDPAYAPAIAGVVLISPNFELNNPQAPLLDLPWAQVWVPLVVGETREWEPLNEGHGRFWTTSYPSVAVFPMRTVQRAAQAADHARATMPMLALYATGDQVVLPSATQAVLAAWGGPATGVVVEGSDDPFQHVIAGDILSPSTTPLAIDTIRDWIAGL